MTYNWSTTFNLKDALAGTLVGFPVSGKSYDLTNTGKLSKEGHVYRAWINGYTVDVNTDGVVLNVVPSNAAWLGQTLQMVTVSMGDEGAVGGTVRRAAGSVTIESVTYNDKVNLTVMEPRDSFAIQILNAMLIHADHPETFNDAAMLRFSTAAYKWAQAMMQAAANSRLGQAESQGSQEAAVNPVDLQSNTEKLLYNMSLHLKGMAEDGMNVSISGTPSVNVANTPLVSINGTPSVNVANSPSVSVSNMPSEPIEIEGTVSVDNFPSSE